MGQLVSRPAPPANVRNGRKSALLKRQLAKQDKKSESVFEVHTERKPPVRHRGNHKSPAKTSDKTEKEFRKARRHSSSRPKETSLKGLEKRDVSGSVKRSHRRKTPDSVVSKSHRNDQAEVPRTRDRLKSRLKTLSSSSSSSLLSVHKTSKKKERKDCVVCANTLSLRHFPNRSPTVQCEHEIDACRKCLRTWLRSEFTTKFWDEMTCPICSLRMQHDDMREFAPSDIFRRYDRLSTRAALEAIPGFTWCIAKGCKSGHIHNATTNKFTCMACKKSHCTQHNSAWHKRETCQEYDYRTDKTIKKEEEAASKKLILETTKKCPGCSKSIEKSYGCDHMTCSRCKYEFCWECLAQYSKGSYRCIHKEDCHWFSRANRLN